MKHHLQHPTPAAAVAEPGRLLALASYDILGTPPDPEYDRLVQLAVSLTGAPMACISLVTPDRQTYKARVGVTTPSTHVCDALSFCSHVVANRAPLVVPDATLDERFSTNPLVLAGTVRSYAGVPLEDEHGFVLGALCVLDAAPGPLDPTHIDSLQLLAARVVAQLARRRARGEDRDVLADRAVVAGRAHTVLQSTSDGVMFLDRTWRITYLNHAGEGVLGRAAADMVGRDVWEEFPAAAGSALHRLYEQALESGLPASAEEYFPDLRAWFEVRAFPDRHGLAVFFRDVDIERRLRDQHRANALFTQAILNSLPAHTVVLAEDGTIVSTNERWDSFGVVNGGEPGSWQAGTSYFEECRRAAASGDEIAAAVLEGFLAVTEGRRNSYERDYECSSPEEVRWFHLQAAPLAGHDGLVVSHTDITTRVLSEGRLAHQARHDSLTDLPNRARLLEVLDEALARPFVPHGRVAVLFVGLDGFKNVNDSLGHDVGDALLLDVAGRLATALRGRDVVGRLGGDEFVVVAHGCGPAEATQLADRLREALSHPFDVADMHLPMTASVGIAVRDSQQARAGDLLRDGDTAMYAAKGNGRDRSQVFSPDLGDAARDRLVLAAELRRAVRNDELVLHYQPILRLPAGGVEELEALMRWNHPTRGLLYPGAFIDLAEETGLIVPMGRWLLGAAMRQVVAWSQHDLDVTIAVNIAAQHLGTGTLVDDVTEALDLAGARAAQLVVELTETDVARDLRAAAAQLETLRGLGVRIAIDDFGSGYSSLGQLATLPVDIVKIDRSLVQDLGDDAEAAGSVARTIVSAVTAIAGRLGMATVAEGIETSEQRAAVEELGCTHAQGFLFARPMPADRVPAALEGVSPTEPG